jgi:hypothetical protein
MSLALALELIDAVAVVALFKVASDLSSLATYFGLLSAGLLLAMQNVILASLGSLVLLGSVESELVTEYRFQVLQAMSSTWDCCNSS